jgi:Na+-translocating ferredoxin:NAD+ oxidoreductase RnfG subunit
MRTTWLLLPTALAASTSGYATAYLTVEQAQQTIFPDAHFTAAPVTLSAEQRKAIETASGVRVRFPEQKIWRVNDDGGWFIVDDVLGKHEFITYAVGLTAKGAVIAVEIMEYRETYGDEIRDSKWRGQFVGKTGSAPLKLDTDIKNITGATLSSRHITEGVKRLLALHALVLASK